MISFLLTRVIAQRTLLAATIGAGMFFCLLLFVFCFSGVHILRFVQKTPTNKKTPLAQPQKAPEEKEKQTPSQEPVYYIVERKQRRSKPRYGEPKEFRFK